MYQNFSHVVQNEELIYRIRNLIYKNHYLAEVKESLTKPKGIEDFLKKDFFDSDVEISENELDEAPIEISLKSGDVEKSFKLSKIPIKSKDIAKFSTKDLQPFSIDLM